MEGCVTMAAAPDTTPSMLVAALWWARQGQPVFPTWWPIDGHCACPQRDCHSPAKHPLTTNGLHDATLDEDTIRGWWGRWPHANIAIPTGHTFDVVDIDGASQAWKDYTALHGTPEHHAIAMSGRDTGGFHLYCSPGGRKTIPSGKKGLPPGVEIKGAGGYVIAPPSMHVTGRPYMWIQPLGDGVITGDVPWDDWYDQLDHQQPTQPPAPAINPSTAFLGPTPTSDSDDRRATAYGQAVLRRAVDAITSAGEGGRWNALALEAAPLIARAIAGGCLDRPTGQAALQAACRTAHLSAPETDRVPELLDRLHAQGITHPIAPPPAVGVDTTTGATIWAISLPPNDLPPDYLEHVDPGERDHTSWWPRNLVAVIAGDDPEPHPAFLARQDGHRLLYPGKVNGLIGESESGKTWIALLAVLQAITTAQHVLYLDFEDTAAGIISRLRALGATDTHLAHLTYIAPDESLHATATLDLTETLTTHTPALVILDGFNAAMTLLGLDLNSNTDATRFSQTLLKPLARTGAAVAYVDHVPKNKDQRGKGGIGAQAKRAMTTGCALTIEITSPFGRGMTGRLRLTVDKDRPGHVREISGGARYAGEAVLTSHDDGTVRIQIDAPDLRPAAERGPWRPTHYMQKVSDLLADLPKGASKKAIEDAIEGKAVHVRKAIDALVAEGYVKRQTGPRGALIHVLDRPFTDDNDPVDNS
jgi:hypothetical protein